MIQWESKYCIGVPFIDEQHEKLFEIANRIYALLKNNLVLDKYDQIVEIIQELQDYTHYHFEAEEKYMQSIGYNKFFSQKVAHGEFLEKMDNIDLTQVDDGQNEYLIEILDFVTDWLVHHIAKKDKLIAESVPAE